GANIRDHVALPLPQIENGVADYLSGTVISNVSATIGVMKRDAGAFENLAGREQVLHVPVASQRDDVWMFHHHQLIANLPAFALFGKRLLNLERLSVIHAPKIADNTGPRALWSRPLACD